MEIILSYCFMMLIHQFYFQDFESNYFDTLLINYLALKFNNYKFKINNQIEHILNL